MSPAGATFHPRITIEDALASARETRALLVGPGVLVETPRIFCEQFPGARAVIVADPTTFRVAGEAVAAALAAAGIPTEPALLLRDPALYAEFSHVERLEAALRAHDAVAIAVGSGTINDLVKLASHRTGRPSYLCVATAASMDGYTAFGASITFQGAKQTFHCPAPRAVVADIDVIRHAPPEMTASGYADLSAKLTAGADWILADALGAEPVDPRAWTIVQAGLRDALADPAGARAGSAPALTPLVEGLMLGGFAMQWSKSSRPASGAEHQFSHLWDMEHHVHQGAAPSHGFKVGIATLAVTRLYEALLAHDFSALDVDACVAAWPAAGDVEAAVRRRFAGADFVETAVTETRAKHATGEDLRAQLQRLRRVWPDLRERLRDQLMPSAELSHRLALAGAPVLPEAIGIAPRRLRDSFLRAYHIRRRFTVLDLVVRTRTLDTLLAALFPGSVPGPASVPPPSLPAP